MKVWLYVLLLSPLPFLGGLALLSWYSRAGSPPGLVENRLAPCPGPPNCVSSEAGDEEHRIAALRFEGDPGPAWSRLRRVVVRMGGRIERDAGGYLHATFRTPLLRFTDDLECRLDVTQGLIHLRSASRVGYSDLGTNRRRVEALRRQFGAQ